MRGIRERRQLILNEILEQGYVKVSILADRFAVTQTTIRKDLSALEKQGLLHRSYGSAIPSSAPVKDISLGKKKMINYDAKLRIARAAAELVEENDSILLASGSTIAVFAENLKPKGRINVVTTAVNISSLLGENDSISVTQVGGMLYSNTLSVYGSDAIQAVRNIFCSKLFFGIDGMGLSHGVTCATREEAELTQAMMHSSAQKIVLCDSSKLGRRGFAHIAAISDIDIIITDSGFPEAARTQFEAAGVKMIVV
jgi:DeoR family transcriptional regulator, aga operon transcriptional repressor